MSRLRLSLTIPGAVSLGAYEGGALAALIVAAKALGEETMVIDSIAAASAGSITALLTARSLLRSVDPVELLTSAWVENVSFQAMKTDSTEAPLSSDALCEMATKVLGPGGIPEGEPGTWQREPVLVSMALTSLAGFTYKLPDLAGRTTVDASTFLDWYQVTLTSAVGSDGYLEHAQAAIASGSNAIGFPAKQLKGWPTRRSTTRPAWSASPTTGCSGTPTAGRSTTNPWAEPSIWPKKSAVTTSGSISLSIPIPPSRCPRPHRSGVVMHHYPHGSAPARMPSASVDPNRFTRIFCGWKRPIRDSSGLGPWLTRSRLGSTPAFATRTCLTIKQASSAPTS